MNVFWPSITHSSRRVVERRAGAGRARVGAGLGFGEPERAEHLARDHRHEVLLLLVLGAAVEERRRAEAHARLERDRHRRVDPRDLLDREAVREVVGAAAAVLLAGTGRPNRPSLPIARTVSTGNAWSRSQSAACGAISRLGELAHDGAELLLLRGEVEVHGRDRTRVQYRSSRVRATARIRPASVLRHLPPHRGCAIVRDGDHRRRARAGGRARRERRAGVRRAARDRRRRLLGRVLRVRPRAARSSTSSRAPSTTSASPTSRSRATTRGSCSTTTARPSSSATARPAPARRGLRAADATGRAAAPALDSWTSSLDRLDHAAACAHVHELLARRRVLPGEPHPPAHASTPRPIRSRSSTRSRACNPAPHAALLHVRRRRCRRRGRVGVARAVPARRPADGAARRDPPDQGHRGRRRRRWPRARRTGPRT